MIVQPGALAGAADIVFYTTALGGLTMRVLDKWIRPRWTRRFLIFAVFSLLIRFYWFLVMNRMEFPTNEVYYAVVPALQHPYAYPWEAPYGILWYGLVRGLTGITIPFVGFFNNLFHLGCNQCYTDIIYNDGHVIRYFYSVSDWVQGVSFMTSLAVWDVPFFWLFRKSMLLPAYTITSVFIWATTPVNLPVLWMVALGFYFLAFLPLALLMKFPFGASGAVWNYALHSGSDPGHWFPYVFLGTWFIGAVLSRFEKFRYLRLGFAETLKQENDRLDMLEKQEESIRLGLESLRLE